jgi:hypothetical protein
VQNSLTYLGCAFQHFKLKRLATEVDGLLLLKHPSATVEFVINMEARVVVQKLLILTILLQVLHSLLYSFKNRKLGFRVLVRSDTDEPRKMWREITDMWPLSPKILWAKARKWYRCLGTYGLGLCYMEMKS